MAVPLKYLVNFQRTPEIYYKINLLLTSSAKCVITNSTSARTFAITDTKLCFAVVTPSTQDNKMH